ncbi:hypothetical protein DFJ58DRAFT_380938 [Suillus subalutaceus]|uniref:uncharacterized protein n=1 Tax=Suillus subalutaceus TaxID=48586 RepID=UPI001B85C6BC|nr:uncharacterized protein DFJ58DRAFT_380938 [Suillus subalutaceus]KAG1854481.1 hypothetical protein DFJ58DRAFT_380938 [Suillus subalutaceus]
MVNWTDPEVVSQCGIIVEHINFLCLGLYTWEYSRSWQVELALICRRIQLRWPLLPYITGRLLLLTSMIMICWLSSPTPQSVDCHSAFLAFVFAGNASIGCSSLNLMVRPFVIWRAFKYIRIFLVLATVGHWIMLLRVMVDFSVMEVDGSCGFMVIDHTYMTSIFVYTMCYDILALALTIIGLRNTPSSSAMWKILRKQGIAYVLVTCFVNIIPSVVASLNLNAAMNVVFAMPASVVSTIASSRIVVAFLDAQSSASTEETSSRGVPLTTMLTLPTSSHMDAQDSV